MNLWVSKATAGCLSHKLKALMSIFLTSQSTEDFMNICIEPDNVSKGDFISIG